MDDAAERARARILASLVVLMATVSLAHSRGAPAPTPVPMADPRPAPAARALRDGQKVDLNRAGAPTLELLPGIGPALAGRIVASRQSAGEFSSVDDLQRVRGIGARRVQALRALVQVTPEADSGSSVARDAGPDAGASP